MRRHPDWLKIRIGGGKNYSKMKTILNNAKLHTICQEAKCPNIAECFDSGTAVFLIMGDVCSRNCRYCNVKHGKPLPLNTKEPYDIAESVNQLGLKYVVITSVTRDDLSDGGAQFFYDTIISIKQKNKDCKVEALIPDFMGDINSIKKLLEAKPNVINHNIEVVKELFPMIRPEGDYHRSIEVLKILKNIDKQTRTKSGFMVGLGENDSQIIETMKDLREANVDFLTIGQYLQPSKEHVNIIKYYTPTEFNQLKKIALNLGFSHVESGPLVRSSYHAEKAIF
jgi:lipoic acid synthetase